MSFGWFWTSCDSLSLILWESWFLILIPCANIHFSPIEMLASRSSISEVLMPQFSLIASVELPSSKILDGPEILVLAPIERLLLLPINTMLTLVRMQSLSMDIELLSP